MHRFIVLIFTGLFCVTINVSAQDFIQESIGSENKKEQKKSKGDSLFVPMNKWIGERIIFLPIFKSSQQYGYDFSESIDDIYTDPTDYKKLVGKTATVKAVGSVDGKNLIMVETKNGKKYYSRIAENNYVESIALLNDIIMARKKFLGETIWYTGASKYRKSSRALLTYDAARDELRQDILVSSTEPLKVKNIVAGWDHYRPARFILETKNGNVGYIDVNISGNNVPESSRHKSRFEDLFSMTNPKKIFDWPEEVWNAIDKSEPKIGMNQNQLIMSISLPLEINQTTTKTGNQEQWIYENVAFKGYVYLENGQVTSIQNQ